MSLASAPLLPLESAPPDLEQRSVLLFAPTLHSLSQVKLAYRQVTVT